MISQIRPYFLFNDLEKEKIYNNSREKYLEKFVIWYHLENSIYCYNSDHLGITIHKPHHGLEKAELTLGFLPPYSPDLKPLEKILAKMNAIKGKFDLGVEQLFASDPPYPFQTVPLYYSLGYMFCHNYLANLYWDKNG